MEETVDLLLVEVKASIIENQNPKLKRRFGELKGSIWMSDDFDEPLDEMKDYM
ncbi:MAG: DUF2281 domain-containing protein [Janthinobacterium lividum]